MDDSFCILVLTFDSLYFFLALALQHASIHQSVGSAEDEEEREPVKVRCLLYRLILKGRIKNLLHFESCAAASKRLHSTTKVAQYERFSTIMFTIWSIVNVSIYLNAFLIHCDLELSIKIQYLVVISKISKKVQGVG